MAHRSDDEIIARTHNTARFFVEHPPVAWVALAAVIAWGVFGYLHMPKRKDPVIPIRQALAVCPWPGVGAEKIEQLVTRPMEETIAQSSRVHPPGPGMDFGIRSLTFDGVAFVYIQLAENVNDTRPQFNDIDLRLNQLNANLPAGAGPIKFHSDFGDTATLMLTVASPKESAVMLSLRAREIARAMLAARADAPAAYAANRRAVIAPFPITMSVATMRRARDDVTRFVLGHGLGADLRPLDGPGFVGLDFAPEVPDQALSAALEAWARETFGPTTFRGFHPDAWPPFLVARPDEVAARLAEAGGDKYTYHRMRRFADLIERTLETVPEVARVTDSGELPEAVYLDYSQTRLASYGITPSRLADAISARNITRSAGMINANGADVYIHPSGEFTGIDQIGDVIVGQSSSGSPLYLRDLVSITRAYQSPPELLNFHRWRDAAGRWRRSRAITIAVQMREGEQVGAFGASVDRALAGLKERLPEDLLIARTSDQPRQVRENVALFMRALYEAIALVVLVSWLGFREWRSALLIAISIPITLAMTFGMMHLLGIDIEQVSIATLIIALGLLVDDPVVAGDAIKHELGRNHPPRVAAWLGPTKLERAILFSTIANIVAYLPFLLLTGNTGEFLFSLPIVMTCALVASRIVSMTFVPQLGYYLMRPAAQAEKSREEKHRSGFTGLYYRFGEFTLEHRHKAFLLSLIFLGGGVLIARHLKTIFFPDDVQYLAYVDLFMPNGTAISATNDAARRAEEIVIEAARDYGRTHPEERHAGSILKSVTTFVGGGGPRFWVSVNPESQQSNYAELLFEIYEKEDMPRFVPFLQRRLSAAIPGAWVDVQQLQTNPVSHPIEIHVTGRTDVDPAAETADIRTLRQIADGVEAILRSIPQSRRVRDDWMSEVPILRMPINSDRANLAGLSNDDIAGSADAGLSGARMGVLNDGNLRVPIVARLYRQERSQLSGLGNLYVYASQGAQKVPLSSVASFGLAWRTELIARRDHFRAITVFGFPASGAYASEILNRARPRIAALTRDLPPGYTLTYGGEAAKQTTGFRELAMVLAISVALIFTALVFQFNHAAKPLLVFAAVPYGAVGALAALWIMGAPFGFMAFLGIASLVGVIVSHVIVLFEFIEESQERGEPLIEGLLDAGIERLRPVMVTVGATLLALFPLALEGGPLWQPLCYAQIGGLSLATIIELLLVKVFYVIFVEDLGLVRWSPRDKS